MLRRLSLAMAAAALMLGDAGAQEGYARLEGHGGPVKGLALSPDGALAATASFDNSAGIWSLNGPRHIRWLDGHDAAVNAAAFTPDGDRVLTAIRERDADMPVLLMSGLPESASGVDESVAFLAKPFSGASLLAALGKLRASRPRT